MSLKNLDSNFATPGNSNGTNEPNSGRTHLAGLLANVQEQIAKLQADRDRLAAIVQRLDSELASERQLSEQLRIQRDRFEVLTRAFVPETYPLELALNDEASDMMGNDRFQAVNVLAELEVLHQSLSEKRGQ